jgi:hypothetical protein
MDASIRLDEKPQLGIFALGTASHAYFEFDASERVHARGRLQRRPATSRRDAGEHGRLDRAARDALTR